MGEIQWGLLDPNSFQRGYQQSSGIIGDITQSFQKGQTDAALRGYATHPDDPNALNALAQADPRLAIQLRQQQGDHQQALLEKHRESIVLGAKIIRQLRPTDDATWQQALHTAQQAGVDLTDVPQHYDPNYVQGLISTADALSPEKVTNSRIITPQPGGGAWELNADGTLKPLIQPNDGSQAVGAPIAAGNAPTVTDQASYDAIPPGGQYMSPDGHIRVKQGGPAPGAPGGFL